MQSCRHRRSLRRSSITQQLSRWQDWEVEGRVLRKLCRGSVRERDYQDSGFFLY